MSSKSQPMSETSCEVTRSDQTLINRFARLNAKTEELESDLKHKKRELDNARDALDELALSEEHVLLRAGDVFAHVPSEEAERWCEGVKEALEASSKQLEAQVMRMKMEMSEIKATLYAKFGNNINLEYDDQDD